MKLIIIFCLCLNSINIFAGEISNTFSNTYLNIYKTTRHIPLRLTSQDLRILFKENENILRLIFKKKVDHQFLKRYFSLALSNLENESTITIERKKNRIFNIHDHKYSLEFNIKNNKLNATNMEISPELFKSAKSYIFKLQSLMRKNKISNNERKTTPQKHLVSLYSLITPQTHASLPTGNDSLIIAGVLGIIPFALMFMALDDLDRDAAEQRKFQKKIIQKTPTKPNLGTSAKKLKRLKTAIRMSAKGSSLPLAVLSYIMFYDSDIANATITSPDNKCGNIFVSLMSSVKSCFPIPEEKLIKKIGFFLSDATDWLDDNNTQDNTYQSVKNINRSINTEKASLNLYNWCNLTKQQNQNSCISSLPDTQKLCGNLNKYQNCISSMTASTVEARKIVDKSKVNKMNEMNNQTEPSRAQSTEK